ncbi:MAG: sodium:solute symporter family transporter [Nitrososphaerales archaeon]
MQAILTQEIGYFTLLGVGITMAIIVMILVKAETKWLGTKKTFEWFSTAGRNVKSGLIASSVVSAWTWAATLLQSSTVTYEFGIGGLFWYAAGASIQVVLFAILAIELKRKAPYSHTFPEMIFARFGYKAHKVFLFFALITNIIITTMLILGGAAVVNALTGVDMTIATFLIPIGVIIYTIFGGLKATFFADYLNTAFIFCVVLIFVIAIYFINPEIGGIEGMYNKLTQVALTDPVEGNAHGSYLTLASVGALSFGIINIVGNFGSVFIDQTYWQRAIASRPKSAIRGFLIGGLVWFAIPFTLATSLGLSAISIGISLTPQEIDYGLVAPTAASELLGDLGAILILTVVFTAVTSAGSAQMIAVSSLTTYDIYRTYLKPSASGRELIRISRISIIAFGVLIGVLVSALFHIGLSLQYVYLTMGIIIGSSVIPITIALVLKKTNKNAIIAGALTGLSLGICTWMVTAYTIYGEISIHSTGEYMPLLIGNITSIMSGGIISITISILKPENFNFNKIKQKIFVTDEKIRNIIEQDSNEQFLKNTARFTYKYALFLTFILVIIWPLPLYVSGYVFSLEYYVIWVYIAIIWATGSAITIILLPIIESRGGIVEVIRKITINKHENITSYNHDTIYEKNIKPDYETNLRKILVAIDGSFKSIKSLNYLEYLFESQINVKIFLVHIIEWTEQKEEILDSQIIDKIEHNGRMILKSIVVKDRYNCERIVKLGDPGNKIVDLAEKLDVDLIVMGSKGLGLTEQEIGSVAKKVLRLTRKPVIFL